MKKRFAHAALGLLALALVSTASAQVKPEDQIKFRKSGYSFMAWNMGKIKSNLEGEYNREQVAAAAGVIAAIANSGMGALYGPGTDKDVGAQKTRAKPELFQNMQEVGKLAKEFNAAANNLAQVAASGDRAAVGGAYGDLGKTCKACHDKFRME